MSRCRCCGGEGFEDRYLCLRCHVAWCASPEAKRAGNPTSLTDFINRTRAERQNGAKP